MTMNEPKGYRQLEVWHKAMDFVEQIYQLTSQLPESERFGLKSQMQRAVVSVPCNIAEGYGANKGNYLRHLRVARGSLMELETQIEICVRLKMLSRESIKETWKQSQEISRMITGLIKYLKDDSSSS